MRERRRKLKVVEKRRAECPVPVYKNGRRGGEEDEQAGGGGGGYKERGTVRWSRVQIASRGAREPGSEPPDGLSKLTEICHRLGSKITIFRREIYIKWGRDRPDSRMGSEREN